MKPYRILIIQTAFLGDVILTLPMLQVLKKNYPDSKIDFLCIPQTSGLLKNNPYVNEVIIYDKKRSGIKGFLKLLKILSSNRYDLILSPHRSFRSALISKISFSTKTISFDTSSFSFMYDLRVKYMNDVHEIQRNLRLLEPLGITDDKIIKPELFTDTEEKELINKYLSAGNIHTDEKFICIAPGSVWYTKRFPKEKFVRVCDLLKDTDKKIILIGGESDREITDFITDHSDNKNIINSAGKFSVLGSTELIRRSSILITNDSAPLHIANSVGTKVIAIFGATIPAFGFYPFGENDIIIETNGLSCRPCSIHGGNKCPINTFVCMNDIDERRITDAVILVLK